jgi:hypothetical protein
VECRHSPRVIHSPINLSTYGLKVTVRRPAGVHPYWLRAAYRIGFMPMVVVGTDSDDNETLDATGRSRMLNASG